MNGFEVRVPAVDALSASVVSAASDARSALGFMNGAGCVDAGDAALTGVLAAFQPGWGTFTQGTAQAVDQTGVAIATAAVAYQRVDARLLADPWVTAASVEQMAAGGDGQAALDVAPDLPLPHGQGPR